MKDHRTIIGLAQNDCGGMAASSFHFQKLHPLKIKERTGRFAFLFCPFGAWVQTELTQKDPPPFILWTCMHMVVGVKGMGDTDKRQASSFRHIVTCVGVFTIVSLAE